MGVVTAISCVDIDCALGSPKAPKGLMRKKPSRAGAIGYTCSTNTPGIAFSSQLSGSHFRTDPKSNLMCLICTAAVNGSVSIGRILPRKDSAGEAREYLWLILLLSFSH